MTMKRTFGWIAVALAAAGGAWLVSRWISG